MSAIYNLEPPTTGRLVIHTDPHGPLEVELWAREAPHASRNFVQHALDGYYDNLAFHRVEPGVLAQTGDPTGTREGGAPAIGDKKGYPKELHGRLRFRRRGLLAMVVHHHLARSQFFLTLAATPWLDTCHTIFGCVVGHSVYNLTALGSQAVDGFHVEAAPRVVRIEVLDNPFPDICRRVTSAASVVPVQGAAHSAKNAVSRADLLSFQASDSEDSDVDGKEAKQDDRSKANARLAKPRIALKHRPPMKRERSTIKQGDGERDNQALVRQAEKSGTEKAKETEAEQDEVTRAANAEFERLRAEMGLGSGTAGASGAEQNAKADEAQQADKAQQADGSEQKERTADKADGSKRKRRADENETLRRLKAFERRMVTLRRKSKTDGVAAWFHKGLTLAGPSAHEEEQYDVHYPPAPNASRRRAPRRLP